MKGKVFHIPVFRAQVSGGSQFVKFNEGRTTEPRRSEPECKKAKEGNIEPRTKSRNIFVPKSQSVNTFVNYAAKYVLRLKLISPA